MKKVINTLTEKEKKKILRAGRINDSLNANLTKIMPVPLVGGIVLILLYAFGLEYTPLMIWGMALLFGSSSIPIIWLCAIYIAAAGSHGKYSYPLYQRLLNGETFPENDDSNNLDDSYNIGNHLANSTEPREIEKLANEKFNGDIYAAIEYAYRTWGKESNERMDKIYNEFTDEDKKIASEVIRKLATEKYGKNALKSIAIKLGAKSLDYFNFNRAKKLLKKIEAEEELPKVLPRINLLGCACLIIALINFGFGISEGNTLKEYQKNGVAVTASVYQVDRDDTDHYVHFKYEYGNKSYTWCEDGSDCREGDIITAYIYPSHPEKLYIFNGFLFPFSFLMLMLGAFLFWMENGYPKHRYSLFVICEGILMMIIGIIYNLNTWVGWGVFFALLALVVIGIGIIRKKHIN